jgi:hypothetical protein
MKSRRMRSAGHVARMGEKMNAYMILVGKPEGKRPLWRPRRRWVDNIVTDLSNTSPGNSSVNTVQHAAIEEAVFSVDPTDAPIDWLDSNHVISVYCRSMSVPRLYTGYEIQIDNPTCERCLEEYESATHILCDCEAITYLKFRHLGQFLMEPSDYYDAPINKVLHFIWSVGLT